MSIVHLKNKKNGTIYVYESHSYWDKEKSQPRNTRTCIGKLDPDTKEVIYNARYQERQQSHSHQGPGRPSSLEYRRYFYGATYLLDQIGEMLGIDDDLKACFPDTYKQILSIAYYLILEAKNPLVRFGHWERMHKHPYGKPIPSQRSSELFASIGEDAKQRFFSLQSARRLEEEYLAYDTTSISSYSQMIKQVKYGLNKDHDPLAQINLALLMGQSSRLPISYRKLPGNISDVTTIRKLLGDLKQSPLKKVKLVLDRGFYSRENINALYTHHYKFLIATKTSLGFVKSHLDEAREDMVTRANYSSAHRLYLKSFPIKWNYTYLKPRSKEKIEEQRRLYLHLYYNDQRATDEKVRFNALLDQLEEELLSGRRDAGHEKLYQKYFTLKETPVRGIRISPNETAIKEKEERMGYFALISNTLKSATEAIDIYRSKDSIEKAYDDLKNRLNMRRTSVSSEESLEGKLFVQFVALIYLSYMKHKMDSEGLFKRYSLQGALDELDIIEQFAQPGRSPATGEVTKKQRMLYEALGVEVLT
jgi:transposase